MFYLLTILTVGILLFLAKRFLTPSIFVLLKKEAKGSPISKRNLNRFSPEEWITCRRIHFGSSFRKHLLDYYAKTGKILDLATAKKEYNFRGDPSYFSNLSSHIEFAVDEKMMMDELCDGVLSTVKKSKIKLDHNSPTFREDKARIHFKEIYPNINFEIHPPEKLAKHSDQYLTEWSQSMGRLINGRFEREEKLAQDLAAIDEKYQIRKEAIAKAKREEESQNSSSGNNFFGSDEPDHGLPERETVRDDDGSWNGVSRELERNNPKFPFPTQETWWDSDQQCEMRIERELLHSNPGLWVYRERRLKNKNGGYFDLISEQTVRVNRS